MRTDAASGAVPVHVVPSHRRARPQALRALRAVRDALPRNRCWPAGIDPLSRYEHRIDCTESGIC